MSWLSSRLPQAPGEAARHPDSAAFTLPRRYYQSVGAVAVGPSAGPGNFCAALRCFTVMNEW